MDALGWPTTEGCQSTQNEQVLCAAIVPLQPWFSNEKSPAFAPEIATFTVSGMSPGLPMVTVVGPAIVSTSIVPKFSFVGDGTAAAQGPRSVICCCAPGTSRLLSVIVRLLVKMPLCPGAKAMDVV